MSNITKLIIGIVLVIIMIPAMGTVYVKDNLHNSYYCAACHQEYYETWAVPDIDYTLAHVHYGMGVSCQKCHQRTLGESIVEVGKYLGGNNDSSLPMSEVTMDKCFACHESYEKLIPPISTRVTLKDRNPHTGHWGELECSECHNSHQDSVVYCDECHHPNYMEEESPGWTDLDSK